MTPRDPRPIAAVQAALSRARGDTLKRLAAELADDDRAGIRSAVEAALAREQARSRESRRLGKLYSLEKELRERGFAVVAGVDEVGRGALAGPLTAGACVLPPTPRLEGLNDSKQLTPQRREELAKRIREIAICWSVAHITAEEVDALGMTEALRRVAGHALVGLEPQADHVVVDGRPMGISDTETAVIKGDSKVAAVAAASILAKVERDGLMVGWAREHPHWGFEVNKGYGTPEHLAALSQHGMSPLHRRSFHPAGGTTQLF